MRRLLNLREYLKATFGFTYGGKKGYISVFSYVLIGCIKAPISLKLIKEPQFSSYIFIDIKTCYNSNMIYIRILFPNAKYIYSTGYNLVKQPLAKYRYQSYDLSKGYNTFGCTVLQHYREDPPGLFPLETLKIDINFKYVYCMYHMIHVTGLKE